MKWQAKNWIFKKLQLEKFMLPTKSLPKLNLRLQFIVKMGLIFNLTKSEPDYSTENLKDLEWRALPTELLLLNCSQQLMMRICLKLDIAVNTSMCSWGRKMSLE
jgi:hypothetical protein